MSTSLIQWNLWKKLQSKKYRHSFVSSQIGASVAAQIASTRVARGWTQKELAKRANMSQVRISVLEDPSYENFSIKTLKRIAEAFDTALILRFAPFSEMLDWLTTLRPAQLAVPKFDDDSLKINHDNPLETSSIVGHPRSQEQTGKTAAALASFTQRDPLPAYGRPTPMACASIPHTTQKSSAGRLQCV